MGREVGAHGFASVVRADARDESDVHPICREPGGRVGSGSAGSDRHVRAGVRAVLDRAVRTDDDVEPDVTDDNDRADGRHGWVTVR